MEQNLTKQIDIFSILRDVLHEWATILLFAVSVSLLTNVAVVQTYQPEYTAKAIFTVSAKSTNNTIYQDLSSAEDLAKRFTQLLDSTVLKKTVAKDLGQDTFTAETSVKQIEKTNMVELNVSANSAMDAYRTIRSIMSNYNTVSDYVLGNVIMYVIQQPSIPLAPINSRSPIKPMAYTFFLALALGIFYIAVLSYRRDTVKNAHQVREKVDAKLLGTISHERVRRQKNKEHPSMLMDNPLRSFAFVESNRMMASRVRSRMDRKQAKVALITSVAENEGKSTVAANLAMALAKEGKHVLLIDCDFRKPSQYKIFQRPEHESIDLLQELRRGTAERVAMPYKTTSMYVLFNSKADASAELVMESGELRQMIHRYRAQMDYIILDTAPLALVSDTEEMARLADTTILVVREDAVLASKINDCIDILNQTDAPVLGCVLNNSMSGKVRSSASKTSEHAHVSYGGHYGKTAK